MLFEVIGCALPCVPATYNVVISVAFFDAPRCGSSDQRGVRATARAPTGVVRVDERRRAVGVQGFKDSAPYPRYVYTDELLVIANKRSSKTDDGASLSLAALPSPPPRLLSP